MPFFKTKPQSVEAFQWDVSADSYKNIQNLGCQTKPGEMGSGTFYLVTEYGDIKVSKDDWVIRFVHSDKTEFIARNNHEFNLHFEQV